MKPLLILMSLFAILAGCKSPTRPGDRLPRTGDEVVIAGQHFHTGAPVVLWTDPGGYDAYRTERRFAPLERSSIEWSVMDNPDLTPNRYGIRASVMSDAELEITRSGGWPLELLQEKVDQFVIHYDACGTSRTCFKVLHDSRNLSVQFMLDIDGTIYQTMDAKERAWHASKANSRSIGIEIANMGAHRSLATLDEWYEKHPDGRQRITIPARFGDGGVRGRGPFFSARDEPVRGEINGETYLQYDLTPQQYDSLIKLTATLCTALPRITLDYPKDHEGKLIASELPEEIYTNYQGLLGHYNVTKLKQDPGPAFQWDRVIDGARRLMSKEARRRNDAMRGKPVRTQINKLTDAPKGPRLRPATQPITQP